MKKIIVVGAQKSGTTWLFEMLQQHPQIGFAHAKEVHYFDRVDNGMAQSKEFIKWFCEEQRARQERLRLRIESLLALKPINSKYHDIVYDPEKSFTDEWYEQIFTQNPENLKRSKKGVDLHYMEASPSYLTMSETGFQHLAKVHPNLKPCLMIRDPKKRMISGLTMGLARHGYTDVESDIKMLKNKLFRFQKPRGDYHHGISLLEKYFQQVHYMLFGRIKTEPLELMSEFEGFYGLDPHKYSRASEKVNSWTGKIELPDEILSHIDKLCEPQYEFLKNKFGSDVLNHI